MAKKLRTLSLCLGLLISASTLQGSQSSDQRTPAQRLVAAADTQEMFKLLLKMMFPPGPTSKVVDVLVENDGSLWDDFEAEYVRSLEASLDAGTLTEVAAFFESPSGRAWSEALGEVLQHPLTTPDNQTSEFSGGERSPLARLLRIFEFDGDLAEIVSRSLSRRQLRKVAKFYESPLGQQWLRTSGEIHEELLNDFGSNSIRRRFAVKVCVAAIVAPNLNTALQSAGVDEADLTTDTLGPLLGLITSFESMCNCGIGRLFEQLGPVAFRKLQEVQAIFESGDCIPSELQLLAATVHAKQAIIEIRNIGIAMTMWLADQVSSPNPTFESPLRASKEGWFMTPEEGNERVFFSRVSVFDLEQLLVPKYLAELPRTDGWGHEYEFAINHDLLADYTLSIRSPGRDGVFEKGAYEIGSFSVEDDRDLVWADGYFVMWPEIEPP